MNLDELLNLTEDCKKEIATLNWHEDDVRHSFFGLYYSTIYDYYIGKVSYGLAELIGKGQVLFKGEVYEFKTHAKRLYEIQDHQMLSAGYHNNLNRNIVFGTWTTFEFSISLIFDYLVNDYEYETIIKKLNAKLVKAISSLEESNKSIIIDILKQTAFVPLFRKFNFIINKNKANYKGDLTEDRKFIDFVNRLRNCMIHSNGFYHGKYFKYEFSDTEFIFENKEIFSQVGENQDVYLDISLRLKEIFKNLTDCITEVETIPYPEDGQRKID